MDERVWISISIQVTREVYIELTHYVFCFYLIITPRVFGYSVLHKNICETNNRDTIKIFVKLIIGAPS